MLIFAPGALGAVDQTTSYQIDPTHNGVLTGFDLPLPLERRWSVTLAGSVVTPLVVNGVVYVASQAGPPVRPMVHALRQDSGETLWTHVFDDSPTGLTYDRGRIFALDSEGALTALDARTGDVAWSVVVPGQYSFRSPPTASGGIIYTTGNGYHQTLFATDESTGALLWSGGGFEGGSDSTPTVDDGKVYLACPSSYHAFDSWSGTAVWSPVTDNAGGGGTAAVSADGQVYIRDWTRQGRIVDAITGAMQGPLSATAPPAVYDGAAFELTGDGSTPALERIADDGLGAREWSFDGDGGLTTAPIVVGGVLFIGSSGGHVYAVDPVTGAELWQAPTDAPVNPGTSVTTPVLSSLAAGNGTLLVPAGATLIAFGPTDVGDAAPDATGAPSLQGPSRVGERLTIDAGVWSGRPAGYAFHWSRCDPHGDGCTTIADATEMTYVPVADDDVGATLRGSVTASNGYGSSLARSTPASEPVARNAPPVNTQLPALVGSPEIGGTLHTTNGSWTNEPGSFDIRWLRCDERNCMAIPQVVGDTYVVGESDAGYRIAVDVTAVAATGRSRTARSATVAVPGSQQPAPPPPSPPAPPPPPPPPPDEPPGPSRPGPAPVVATPAADDSPASTDDHTVGPSTVAATSATPRPGPRAVTTTASVTRSTDRLSIPRHATLNDLRRHGMGVQAICASACVARVVVYVPTRHGRTTAAKTTRRVASAASATFRVRFGVRGRRLLRTMRGRRLTVVGVLRDVAGRQTPTTSRPLVR